MIKQGATQTAIWNAQMRAEGQQAEYWRWLGSALRIAKIRFPELLAYENDLERAYGAAKQVVMEFWAIRAFLNKLKISTEEFDEIAPQLKSFRDAIAHIDERADGLMLINRSKKVTVGSKASIAGGNLKTVDGIHWSGMSYLYGLSFSSEGLHTCFGMAKNWIITNTDQGAIDLHLSEELLERIDEFIKIAAESY